MLEWNVSTVATDGKASWGMKNFNKDVGIQSFSHVPQHVIQANCFALIALFTRCGSWRDLQVRRDRRDLPYPLLLLS
ncbi:uncharacterized [Tachysurus ichikawai]